MNSMVTSNHPARLRLRRVPLAAGLAAVADARAEVRAALSAWHVPVDSHVAALLTSELVTNAIKHEAIKHEAIKHEAGPAVTLAIKCSSGTCSPGAKGSAGQLRVDVHDTSRAMPAPADAPADAEAGRGLAIVATLATEWGFYATPSGKTVYFTLAFPSGHPPDHERGRNRA